MWKDLTMSERAALIKLGVDNGVTNLKDIRDTYNKYAEGGEIESVGGGEITEDNYATNLEIAKDVGKIALSYVPIVGTIMDGYELYKNPSWENLGWFGLSLGSDILGASLAKGALKTANALRGVRAIEEANRLRKINKLYKTGSAVNKTIDNSANTWQLKEDFKTIKDVF